MTTKHSLFTRGLSLVLALVMILSNMSGLTIQAKAAEALLFDVIAASTSGSNAALNTILANPSALPKLEELNVAVDLPEAPEDAQYTMINGRLELYEVGDWYPMYYINGEDQLPYAGPVQLDKELEFTDVIYGCELTVSEQVEAVYEYVEYVGGQAAKQREQLNNISGATALTALSMMDYDFIDEMILEVESLTVEDLGIEVPTPEDYDIDVDYLVEHGYIDPVEYIDFNRDGVVDADEKAQLDAEIMADPAYNKAIQDAIDSEIAKQLKETKQEYVAILEKMLNRLVEGDNFYMQYLDRKGRPEYEDYLVVYAMLSEYDVEGLYHYYLNPSYINAELKALSGILYEILGEKKADGSYENEEIVDALLKNMDYDEDVQASQLGTMAERMEKAAKELPNYMAVIEEIDMTDEAAVDALFFAKNREDTAPISQFASADVDSNLNTTVTYLVFNEIDETVEPGCLHENLVHMDAVEPACHYNGNIEYWVCYDCEGVWQNQTLTQLTNIKNVVLPALGGEVVHVAAVAPTCSSEGNIEHWYCEDCQQVWQNEALTQLTNFMNVKLAAAEHDVTHFEAVEPACHYNGNIEYWVCYDCEGVWQNEALTQLTNIKNVVLPAVGGEVTHVEAVAPGCENEGNIEYWYCAECEQVWQNEALTQLTNIKNVVLPVTHNVAHVEAAPSGCGTEGNIEYWYCLDCNMVWADEGQTQVTNHKNVLLPADPHDLIHIEAVAPGCHYEGNIEHWYCTKCETVWADEALTQITNHKNVIVPALGGEVIHVEAVAPGCENEGNIEYWYCEDCEQVWQNEALTQLTNIKNVVLPVSHNVIHVEAVEATCIANGNIEHWYCEDCDLVWADERLTQVTNHKSVILPGGHDIVHVDAVEPGCHYTGNIEHWYCTICECVWQDEALTQVTNHKNVILPALGGEVEHFEAIEPACHYDGNIEYWVCYECEQVWQNEALTQLTNIKNVVLPALGGEVSHVEAIAPACHYDGNIEYWTCADCGCYWQDEALTQLTNAKRVILPALGGEVEHFEAVEPACHYDGNIEYWVCYECEQVWQNEALTQLTNIKNVILPALGGEVVHVEAVAPTFTSKGNIEYWFCEDCEQVWQDEALTQLTNIKNVIIPMLTGNTPDTAIEVQFEMNEEYTEGTLTLTVGTGTWYYAAYGIAGMELTVNGEPHELNAGMGPWSPSTFVIDNQTGADAQYELAVSYPVGTYMNPEQIWNFSNIQVSIEEGNTQGYYLSLMNYRATGTLVLNLAEITDGVEADVVLTNMTTYEMGWMSDSDNGTVSIGMKPGDEIKIQVVTMPDASWNYPAAEITLTGEIEYPVGSMENPDTLVMGENNAVIEEGNFNGYFYNWTADKKGTLVLTMPEGDWMYVVNNMTTYVYGDTQWSDSDPVVNPAYVLVEKGDEIQVIVNTYDPNNMWSNPAGTISFKAATAGTVRLTFKPAGGVATWSVGTYQVGYVLTEADAAKHADAIAAKVTGNKVFDREAFMEQMVGYRVTKAQTVEVELVYMVTVNGEQIPVLADDAEITLSELGYEGDGQYIIVVNGEEMIIEGTETAFEIDVTAANTIEVKEFTSRNRMNLLHLVKQLNAAGNAGYYKVETGENGEDILVAQMSLNQFAGFGTALFEAEHNGVKNAYLDVQLNGRNFIYNKGGVKVDMSAIVSALLEDEKFSSKSLIALGNAGKGELLHATMTANADDEGNELFECEYVLYLNSTPAQMKQVASLLETASSRFWFTAGEGYLDVSVKAPEEVYEAYILYALLTGGMDKSDVSSVSNLGALAYVEGFMNLLQDETITTNTYTNTLKMLGVNKNLNAYSAEYEFLQGFLNDETKFNYQLGEKTSTVNVNVDGVDIDTILESLMGTTLEELGKGVIADDDTIKTETQITIVNEIPDFEAAIIDPARRNNAGVYAKIQAIDLTDNLAAENIQGAAAVMLLQDVQGDITFNTSTLLDLNGHTINGNVKANGTLVIFDSAKDTVSGAGVTGTVSGSNVTILEGTYGSNVKAYLQNGYYQDNSGAVKNVMYTIENGKMLIDYRVYTDNVDGYLPAVQHIAVQAALNLVLNNYFVGGLYAEGKSGELCQLYDISFEDLLYIVGTKDTAYVMDEILDFINVAELTDFTNNIIADLINIDRIAASLNNGGTIASYNFSKRPWNVSLRHVVDGDYLTFDIIPSAEKAQNETLSLGLILPTDAEIPVPGTDRKISAQDILNELARIVVTTEDVSADYTELELSLKQPTHDGKTINISGSATATINLDFSHNSNYNRVLAAVLAYYNDELSDTLVKEGCIVDLNEAMHDITLGQLIKSINAIIQNEEIPFEKIAAELGLNLPADQLNKLNKAYDMFQNGVAKVITKFNLGENASTPLSGLVDNDGVLNFFADIQPRYKDVYYNSYGINAELGYSSVKVIVKFANEHEPADAVIENEKAGTCQAEGSYDEVVYCSICGEELSRETIYTGYADHNAAAAVIENEKAGTCEVEGSYDEVVYCSVCGEELSRNTVYTGYADHIAAAAVIENEKAGTCEVEGSYDEVVYCSVCGEELSRNTVYTGLVDHVAGEAVREDGQFCEYDMVVYCTVCGEELSRENHPGLWGDVNCDGEIDARDAAWILKYDVELVDAAEKHFSRADVNADGEVDARDAAWIKKYDVELVSYEEFPAVVAENG